MPVLQRRQGVDVLHIGHAARHAGQHPVDGLLVQFHQGQQVRGDARAISADEVGRHLHFPAAAHGIGQGGQGRLAEQHPHIGAQADLAHALDQAHRQQRVPAQLEEVVVAPHLLHLEQLAPDPRQGDFHLAPGGDEFTAEQGRRGRRRQRLAVQLAVVGQGQGLQVHIGQGHHVVRQLLLQVAAQLLGIRRRGVLVQGVVGHQALVPGAVFTHHDHAVPQAGEAGQLRLDFPGFDAQAADLHLLVIAPDAFQKTIFQPAAQVAGAVHQGRRSGALGCW